MCLIFTLNFVITNPPRYPCRLLQTRHVKHPLHFLAYNAISFRISRASNPFYRPYTVVVRRFSLPSLVKTQTSCTSYRSCRTLFFSFAQSYHICADASVHKILFQFTRTPFPLSPFISKNVQ